MSECFQEIQRTIQSYDEREMQLCVARMAEAAHQSQVPIESLIVDLKDAVNALPASCLRERARSELRDEVVRVAIRGYYEGAEAVSAELAGR
jgi:hypothetical protein